MYIYIYIYIYIYLYMNIYVHSYTDINVYVYRYIHSDTSSIDHLVIREFVSGLPRYQADRLDTTCYQRSS